MHGIGEFAQMAKVSVRTLRHYDEIGLLHPASVDASSGYRSYAASQLSDLHRIIALKDVGLSLSEIHDALGQPPDAVAAMLEERLIDLEAALEADRRRVERLRARLNLMSGDHPMSDHLQSVDADVVVKPIDPHRVAAASATAADFEVEFAPIFAKLYPTIYEALGKAGIVPGVPTVAFYEVLEDGQVKISAGVTVADTAEIDTGEVRIVELPGAPRGATIVHRGPMTTVDKSFLALDQWVTEAGETIDGMSREVYHNCPPGDQSDWVTELQFILA